MTLKFNVYMWKLDSGEPIYVGRSRRPGRALEHLKESESNEDLKKMFELLKRARNHIICEIRFVQDEQEAIKIERRLLRQFRNSGLLANKANGIAPINWELFEILLWMHSENNRG